MISRVRVVKLKQRIMINMKKHLFVVSMHGCILNRGLQLFMLSIWTNELRLIICNFDMIFSCRKHVPTLYKIHKLGNLSWQGGFK